MGAQKIKLTVNSYFDEELELTFPASWEVVECRMAGHDKPALTDEEMRAAVRNPIGSPRLKDLANGKQKVVILFDDVTKPTPTGRIASFVLEELREGGIRDDQIRFLCAPGTHKALSTPEFVMKLGAEIVAKYPVYNHNVYENLVEVGTTSRGTCVQVNREYASCDLRVAIGSILPHPSAGFGAGGKIVMPGIAGMETVVSHHTAMRKEPYGRNVGAGKIDGNDFRLDLNDFRLDLEEAARLAGLSFTVDSVLNNHREVVGLFAGDFVAEHRAGVSLARELYQTEMVSGVDVLVSNAYPNEYQFSRAVWLAPRCLREGGDLVVVGWSRGGQAVHQYMGRFGTDFGGRGWSRAAAGRVKTLANAGRIIILTPFLSQVDRMDWGGERVVWCKSWEEVLAELATRHGPGAKVAVYPYAPLQVEG